ncbi:hypothetical protein NDU88_004653 [Pleurodeles waltl]|uniref:Uncharacterized protein n=1 Tax=Pleurodeles waltl TaxID=8319 RepID=A0AAV7UG47_PLEWA|nr:hypothetical protein NDU88_004653 [Pleurodeles waltl]
MTSRASVLAVAPESAGGRPRGNGLASAAPPVIAAHLPCCSGSGSLPVQHDLAPPIDRAAASSQPRAAPAARVPAPGVRPQLRCPPPSTAVLSLFSECNTARHSASRHKFVVGSSGAERLSVRHARLHGHAPMVYVIVIAQVAFTACFLSSRLVAAYFSSNASPQCAHSFSSFRHSKLEFLTARLQFLSALVGNGSLGLFLNIGRLFSLFCCLLPASRLPPLLSLGLFSAHRRSQLAPFVISSILDTDDDNKDSVSETNISEDDVSVYSPPPKKAKMAQEANQPPVISDAEGVPMFNPSDIHHPNSTEWFPADNVGDYVATRLRTSLNKQTRAKLQNDVHTCY